MSRKKTATFEEITNNAYKNIAKNGQPKKVKDVSKDNPFPIEVFPKAMQEIIIATNEALNFPVDFMGGSMLCALSVAIGNTHEAQVKNTWQESAVLYMVLVGAKGTNKSHPLNFALKPLKKRDRKEHEFYTKDFLEYEAYMSLSAKEKKESGMEEKPKPTWKQHIMKNATPEGKISALQSNVRGLGAHWDEFTGWFKSFDQYSQGAEEQSWLSAWSGEDIVVNRKGSEPIYIHNPTVSVFGTTQAGGVLTQMTEGRVENGFMDRMLFVTPDELKREYWTDKELDYEVEIQWDNIIVKLANLKADLSDDGDLQAHVLKFTPEAKKRLYKWKNDSTDFTNKPNNEHLGGLYAKAEIYTVRFSLILQMTKFACGIGGKNVIELDTVESAIKLIEYFINSATQVHEIVSNRNPVDSLDLNYQNIYEELSDQFTTGEGLKIAEKMGMKKRTFERFLTKNDIFSCRQKGFYEKKY